MALLVVAEKGAGLDDSSVRRLIVRYGVQPYLSPKERQFIADPHPSKQDRANFSWRFESAWLLLWALGYVDRLDRPSKPISADRALDFLQTRTAHAFVTNARLRPQREILDAADLIYRYDWAIVDARVGHTKIPAWLNSDVVVERHMALNWLFGYMNQAWDDVTPDT